MRRKKGDLSLSVNAIVIFVLAFAMLGVGLFISNMVKERAGTSIDMAFGSLGSLEQKPDATTTVTFPEQVSIKQDSKTNKLAGFYNKKSDSVQAATIMITQCIFEDNSDMSNLPSVSSSSGNVEPGDAKAFNLVINLKETLYETGTYTCTLTVCEKDKCNENKYAERDFFLQVTG
jgi:hypothetical protein